MKNIFYRFLSKPFLFSILLLFSVNSMAGFVNTYSPPAPTPPKTSAPTPPSPAPTDDPSDLMPVVNAISALGTTVTSAASDIKALIIAAVDNFNNMMYQLDQCLPTAQQTNSEKTDIATAMQTNTAQTTTNELSTSMRQIPEAVVSPPADSDTANEIQQRTQQLTQLTTNLPASDTLYLDPSQDATADSDGVSKPATLYDNYFNIDSLLSPPAYNSAQQQAAQQYIFYTSQLYQSLLSTIDFTSLRQKLTSLSDPKDRATLIKNVVTDPSFQKYQLTVRSIMALKSAALSNLNWLAVERTPIKDLATKAGIPNDPNLTAGYASPMEVESYIANHRLLDSQWFSQMQNASPAAVAREQVLILAEIESQLYRNHLDNERILAALAVMTLGQQSDPNIQSVIGGAAKDADSMIKTKMQDIDTNSSSSSTSLSS